MLTELLFALGLVAVGGLLLALGLSILRRR